MSMALAMAMGRVGRSFDGLGRGLRFPGVVPPGEPPGHRAGARGTKVDDGLRRGPRPGLDHDQGGFNLNQLAATGTCDSDVGHGLPV
jgi:hypothetical protein